MVEQRAKVMGKTAIANVFKQAKADLRRKHKKDAVTLKSMHNIFQSMVSLTIYTKNLDGISWKENYIAMANWCNNHAKQNSQVFKLFLQVVSQIMMKKIYMVVQCGLNDLLQRHLWQIKQEEWPTELPPYLAQPWDCMSIHTQYIN